jgi:hypothetical protein
MVPRDPIVAASNAFTDWGIEKYEEGLFPRKLSRNEDHFVQAENTP